MSSNSPMGGDTSSALVQQRQQRQLLPQIAPLIPRPTHEQTLTTLQTRMNNRASRASNSLLNSMARLAVRPRDTANTDIKSTGNIIEQQQLISKSNMLCINNECPGFKLCEFKDIENDGDNNGHLPIRNRLSDPKYIYKPEVIQARKKYNTTVRSQVQTASADANIAEQATIRALAVELQGANRNTPLEDIKEHIKGLGRFTKHNINAVLTTRASRNHTRSAVTRHRSPSPARSRSPGPPSGPRPTSGWRPGRSGHK